MDQCVTTGREKEIIPWLGNDFVQPLNVRGACLNRPKSRDLMIMLTAVKRDVYWSWCAADENCAAAERKEGTLRSPSLYASSREKRRAGFIFKAEFNICSPTKPKPTEYRICSPRGSLLCYSCHLNRVLPLALTSSQLDVGIRTQNSSHLKAS